MRYFINSLIALVVVFGSCIEDKGNYDYMAYDEIFPVEIADFQEDFDNMDIIPAEPLYYEPVFTLMDDVDRYTYSWYVHYMPSGYAIRQDLADTRILDIEQLSLAAGYTYTLYFEVFDPVLNVAKRQSATITPETSPIGLQGLYVMKDVDGYTEIDYFKFSYGHNIAQQESIPFYSNLVSSIMLDEIEGRPVNMQYVDGNYYWEQIDEEGNSTTTTIAAGCWFIFSENDILSVQRDMSVIYKRSYDHFFVAPENIRPQILKPAVNFCAYFMNDNQVYGVYQMAPGVGRYNKADQVNGVHASTAGMLVGSWYALFFDELSGNFYYAYAYFGSLTNASTMMASTTVVNRELITDRLVEPVIMMAPGGQAPTNNYTYTYGLSILRHKTENTYYLARSNAASGGAPFEWIRSIDNDADIIQVPYPVMTSGYTANAIYYAKGNEIWVYVDGGDTANPLPLAQRQRHMATIGDGETVVQIKPAFYGGTGGSTTYDYSWITVTANTSDGNYKVYVFSTLGLTYEISSTPLITFSGEGSAVCSYIKTIYQME